MAVLKHQKLCGPSKVFSIRIPEDVYNALTEFCFDKRITLASAVTHFVDKGLNCEDGKQYEPYTPDDSDSDTA